MKLWEKMTSFYFEQRRIAEILSAVDRKLELECRRKEKLEKVKNKNILFK